MKKLLLTHLFFVFAFAQSTFPQSLQDHTEVLFKKAQLTLDANKPEEALQILHSIKQATKRIKVLEMVACYKTKDYEKVIKLYNEQNNNKDEYFQQINLLYGASLLSLNRYDEAITLYEQLLIHYPKQHLIQGFLGLAYENTGNFKKAVYHYQNAILCNVNFDMAHKSLGKLCYKSNHISQALMCWDMYFTLKPKKENEKVIKLAERALSLSADSTIIDIDISPDDIHFKGIDSLINLKIALKKEYKVPTMFKSAFVKQNYLLIHNLGSFESNGGFWTDVYVPLFQKMYDKKYFKPFIYRMMINSGTEISWKEALFFNREKYYKYLEWFYPAWKETVGDIYFKKNNLYYSYRDDGTIFSVAQVDSAKLFNGPVTFYKNGSVTAKGILENNTRTGNWLWYNEFGNVSAKMDYDSENNFYPTESFLASYNVKDKLALLYNNYQKGYSSYDENGFITEFSSYRENKEDGIKVYFYPMGIDYPAEVVSYKMGVKDGPFFIYDQNGRIIASGQYSKGVLINHKKEYAYNGKLLAIHTFSEGKSDGVVEQYYNSGQLQAKGTYNENRRHGEWTYYYPNGKKSDEMHYKKDFLHGDYVHYAYSSGIPEYTHRYLNGRLVSYTCHNKQGQITDRGSKQSAHYYHIKPLYSNGNIMQEEIFYPESKYNVSKNFNIYGDLTRSEKNPENADEGEITTYYPGNIVASLTIIDILHQTYTEYYMDGSLKTTGGEKRNLKTGEWRNFYPDSTLKSLQYFVGGKQESFQLNYSATGKIVSRDYHEKGQLTYTDFFDTIGNVFESIHYFKDKQGQLHYLNHNKRYGYSYMNGFRHGANTWYHVNGKVKWLGNYVMGLNHGIWKEFYDNGVLNVEGSYEMGNKIGIWTTYHENGKIYTVNTYDANFALTDTSKEYNESGVLIKSTMYKDGKKHGEHIYYSGLGDKILVLYFDYDELIGYADPNLENEIISMIKIESGTQHIATFYANGQKSVDFTFEKGDLHGSFEIYYPNGQLQISEIYYYGFKNGECISYFQDGDIKSKTFYFYDLPNGESVRYYNDGDVKEKYQYKYGQKDGLAEYFNKNGEIEKKIWFFGDQVVDAKYY